MLTGGKYSYSDFKIFYNDALREAELTGEKINKYTLGRHLAKNQQKFTDKQLRAFRATMNKRLTELRKSKNLTKSERELLNYLEQEGVSNYFIYETYAAMNMELLILQFDSIDWDFYSHIES